MDPGIREPCCLAQGVSSRVDDACVFESPSLVLFSVRIFVPSDAPYQSYGLMTNCYIGRQAHNLKVLAR